MNNMIKADFHMHTRFSSDSEASMRSMIEKAISLGLETICFTEHQDFDFPVVEGLDFQLDINAYQKRLFELKEGYQKDIEVLFGVEIGVMPHLADKLDTYVKSYPFDFVIASSHLVEKKDPYYKPFFDIGEKEAIELYFSYIKENVEDIKDFDVYGHLDYVVRYLPSGVSIYQPADFADLIDNALKALISRGKGIEINTSCIKYRGFANPHPYIIKRYKELGGEIITIGSDAHKPERIASGFEEAREILLQAGFKYYYIYKNREPIAIKL